MVYARTTSGFDPLSSRLMLPIFVPVLLLVLLLTERVASAVDTEAARVAALALPLLLVLPGLFRGLDALRESHDIGTQYTSEAVHEFVASPVLDQVPDGLPGADQRPLAALAGRLRGPAEPGERPGGGHPGVDAPGGACSAWWPAGDVCLVWMQTGSTVFYGPEQLAGVVSLERVAGDDFTTVYRLGPHIPGAD